MLIFASHDLTPATLDWDWTFNHCARGPRLNRGLQTGEGRGDNFRWRWLIISPFVDKLKYCIWQHRDGAGRQKFVGVFASALFIRVAGRALVEFAIWWAFTVSIWIAERVIGVQLGGRECNRVAPSWRRRRSFRRQPPGVTGGANFETSHIYFSAILTRYDHRIHDGSMSNPKQKALKIHSCSSITSWKHFEHCFTQKHSTVGSCELR